MFKIQHTCRYPRLLEHICTCQKLCFNSLDNLKDVEWNLNIYGSKDTHYVSLLVLLKIIYKTACYTFLSSNHSSRVVVPTQLLGNIWTFVACIHSLLMMVFQTHHDMFRLACTNKNPPIISKKVLFPMKLFKSIYCMIALYFIHASMYLQYLPTEVYVR